MPARARVDRLKTLYTAAKALHFGWLARGNPHSPSVLRIGVGDRYICQLQRVTIRFCKRAESSTGVRQFIDRELVAFARANPNVVVYAQPIEEGDSPVLRAEYLNGREALMGVRNMNCEEVSRHMNQLRTRSGQRIVTFDRDQATQNPSIQGMWHPMMHQATAMNVVQLPDPQFAHRRRSTRPTATERVLQMQQQQASE